MIYLSLIFNLTGKDSHGMLNKSTDSFVAFFQARNIRNKPIVNRDPQNTRLAEMQNEIQVLNVNLADILAQYLDVSVVGLTQWGLLVSVFSRVQRIRFQP